MKNNNVHQASALDSTALHSQEPWFVAETGLGNKAQAPTIYAPGDELRYIATCNDFLNITPTNNLANARRIVACVNACAGMQTEVLESLKVIDAVGSAVKHVRLCADLLAICKRVVANGIGASDIAAMREAIAKAEQP